MGRLRTCDQNQEGGSDLKGRIADLPNDVWATILSRLEVKEAARTSILAKRWRYLWTYNPHLNFDASSVLADVKWGKKSTSEERPKYMNWVDHVLSTHQALTINNFRVAFALNRDHASDIDRWVKFAITKEVKELELDFSAHSVSYNYYSLRLNLFKDLPSDACLSSLTSLSLTKVEVSGELLEFVLSKCVLLERLSVIGSSDLISLRVAGSSLKLKHLDIRGCLKIMNLEILASELLSFTYFGPSYAVALRYVPSLVEASFGFHFGQQLISCSFRHILGFTSQLEKLSLDLWKMGGKPTGWPVFQNLKHLQLASPLQFGQSFVYVPPILEACPSLEKLTLQFKTWSDEEGSREQLEAAKLPHQSLKEVEILGFTGQLVELDLVLYLVKMTSVLEKIILNCCPPPLMGTPHQHSTPGRLQAAHKCAREVVKKARSCVKVIVR